jgi:hypothetical protein
MTLPTTSEGTFIPLPQLGQAMSSLSAMDRLSGGWGGNPSALSNNFRCSDSIG